MSALEKQVSYKRKLFTGYICPDGIYYYKSILNAWYQFEGDGKYFNNFFFLSEIEKCSLYEDDYIFHKINIILMEMLWQDKKKCKYNGYWKFKGVGKNHKVILKEPSGKEQLKLVAESITAADRNSHHIQELSYTCSLCF